MKELQDKTNQVIHALDQSAAQHREDGEEARAKADKDLAESFAKACRKLYVIGNRIARRIRRNEERAKQGLPPLTLEEQLDLDKKEDVR